MKKMKTNSTLPRRLAVAAALLVVASGSFAQKNIEAAFANFKSDKAVTISESRSRETDPASGQLKERTERVDFSLDASKKNLIDKLCAAFDRDRDASYNEFSHTGNGRSPQPILIGNEISVGVGKDMNYVVMAFADKTTATDKPLNRTAYALEWANEARDSETITGTFYVVYGPIPQKHDLTFSWSEPATTADALKRYREKARVIDLSGLGQSLGDVGSALADLRLGDFGILADSLVAMRQGVRYCRVCYNICDEECCEICSNPTRDSRMVCVVEDVQDVMAIENTMQYRGLYHVLGGVISPMDGIGPSDLQIESLVERIRKGGVEEVILALSPTMEGDTTNYYIDRKLEEFDIIVTVIARGIAQNDELQYTDEVTLGRALAGRVPFGK